MLFNSETYLIFLALVVALYWVIPFRLRVPLLLIASYIFYMTWKVEYGLFIAGLTLFNYIMGLLIAGSEGARKRLLAVTITANLLVLGFFKYTYFTRDIINGALTAAGSHSIIPSVPFQIILPLGISFFVFEFIHYIVDVYKGSAPIKSLPQFALFASFFPTQIAGPIKRFQDFMPQLSRQTKFNWQDFDEGIELIVFGLFKKVLIADNLSYVVNAAFAHPNLLSAADCWLAAYAFAFQVFFDFCGYTDIARGSAQLLGYRVPINFTLPFLAGSSQEFWRRWHLSLSSWLRDYVYHPLGGSKLGPVRAQVNIFATMFLCGLWHGAAINFVLFGVVEGVKLIIYTFWRKLVDAVPALERVTTQKWYHPLAVFVTFHVLLVTFVVFRAENVNVLGQYLSRMFCFSTLSDVPMWKLTLPTIDTHIFFALAPFVVALCIAGQLLSTRLQTEKPGILPMPKGLKVAYLAVCMCLLMALSPDVAPRFIYFQF